MMQTVGRRRSWLKGADPRLVGLSAVGLLSGTLTGCWGGPERVEAPQYDPAVAAERALQQYDTDKDGSLSSKESAAAPALADAFEEIDKDQSGSLTGDELKKRIAEIVQDNVGSMSVACVVLKAGRPVPGVTVRLIPEEFVSDLIGPASGVTGQSGIANIVAEDGMLPGVSAGFYRIELSLVHNGRETIPARFNTKTRLGKEISQSSAELARGPFVFEI
jgi:hypothetical protein